MQKSLSVRNIVVFTCKSKLLFTDTDDKYCDTDEGRCFKPIISRNTCGMFYNVRGITAGIAFYV